MKRLSSLPHECVDSYLCRILLPLSKYPDTGRGGDEHAIDGCGTTPVALHVAIGRIGLLEQSRRRCETIMYAHSCAALVRNEKARTVGNKRLPMTGEECSVGVQRVVGFACLCPTTRVQVAHWRRF